MTTVLYFGREPDVGDDVDSLRRAAPDLDVSRADPDATTEPPSADCVVVDPAAIDGEAVVADLRAAGYRGPVVLFGDGSHATLAARVDELGATTYVRRDVAGGGDPSVRLAEAIERVTTGTGERRETHLALLHELARDLLCVEDDVDAATAVVEAIERVLSVEAAVVETGSDRGPPDGVADDGGRDVSVLAATPGFAVDVLSTPRVDSAVTAGNEARLPAEAIDTAATTDTADAAPDAADGSLVVVPVGDRWSLLVDEGTDRSAGVEFDFVRALASTVEVAFDRAEREARLREERDRIASLFENTSDAIVDVEYVDGDPIVREVNTTFERIFGVTGADVVGRNLDELIVPEGVEAPAEYWKHALAGEPYEREVRRATADGVRDFLLRSVPFDREGTRRGYAIYTDITDRKRIERTLGRFHETTRDLIRAETRTEIAEITVRAATEILGYPVTTVRLYEPTSESLRLVAASDATRGLVGELPDDGPEFDLGWEAFRTGEPQVVDDLRERGVTGTGLGRVMYLPLGGRGLLTLGSSESEAFDESDRRLAGILAANVEVALARAARISVLRDREDELARQNDRLEAFASVVSHDLRNPLSVARGYLGLARDACEGESDPAPHFERVERAHERMNHLITDLLALARQGQAVGETDEVALGAAAKRAWNAVDTGGARLDVVADRTIQADAERLDALFENLFRNSVEHGSTGPRSQAREDSVEHGSTGNRTQSGDSVEHGSTDDDPNDAGLTVRVGAMDDGFFVEDDGPGIPAAERDQVFDRGYSTSDSGTGFGLSIVQGIAEAHGWTIAVAESEAGGARFEVSGVDSTPRDRLD
ncbi:ATP-binding protein [Salinigranum sp. GCM10025319]|uniref:sensor histidine kinase n=1 Tax=Salinigranum sp. GCM10025319 TaxID=3252687 RepID=UPI0036099830